MPTSRQEPSHASPAGSVDVDAEIFAALYPSLRRYAAVVGALSDNPDDLVQEAVARTLATTSLRELRSASAYLRRAISNRRCRGEQISRIEQLGDDGCHGPCSLARS